jgi:hypothetical protein
VSVDVAKSVPDNKLAVVILSALIAEEKRLVNVALFAVRAVMLVVASVEVPRTVKRPVEVAPVSVAINAVFSTQLEPFQ